MIAGLSGQTGVCLCVCVRNTYSLSPTKAQGLLMANLCDRSQGVHCVCMCAWDWWTWALIHQDMSHLSQDAHINVWCPNRHRQGCGLWPEGRVSLRSQWPPSRWFVNATCNLNAGVKYIQTIKNWTQEKALGGSYGGHDGTVWSLKWPWPSCRTEGDLVWASCHVMSISCCNKETFHL